MNKLKPLSVIFVGLFSINSFADITTLQKNLDSIKTTLGNQHVKIIGESPIKGLYELQTGSSLIYADESGQYLVNGDLYDLKNKVNLTTQKLQQLNRIDVNTLPLAQALKVVKGTGTRKLYVFSDPDCPYCKLLEKNLQSVNNVTIYTFMYPLKSLHPNAESVAKQIWCSSDRIKAWNGHLLNNTTPSATSSCSNPIDNNIALGKRLNIEGTPTLFLADGTRISGALAAADLEKILK